MADGIVTHVKNEEPPRRPPAVTAERAHAATTPTPWSCHDDGTSTLHKHLDDALATVGNRLRARRPARPLRHDRLVDHPAPPRHANGLLRRGRRAPRSPSPSSMSPATAPVTGQDLKSNELPRVSAKIRVRTCAWQRASPVRLQHAADNAVVRCRSPRRKGDTGGSVGLGGVGVHRSWRRRRRAPARPQPAAVPDAPAWSATDDHPTTEPADHHHAALTTSGEASTSAATGGTRQHQAEPVATDNGTGATDTVVELFPVAAARRTLSAGTINASRTLRSLPQPRRRLPGRLLLRRRRRGASPTT